MRELGELMLAVLAALTAENLFFSQGMGFDRVLQAARRGTMLGIYALLVTLFSLVSGLLLFWLSGMVPVLWLPLVSAGVTGGVYLLVCIVLVMGAPEWYRKISWCLAPAAINTVVFSIPFLVRLQEWNPWQAIGFSLGTGVAFWLAAWLLTEMIPRLRHISMPAAFRGMPAVFLYMAILALAFLGFAR
ncbi:MAG TPA: hypothetical protein IAA80_07815 [Candidatus Gallacutalibacter pullistercoris]|nr:hypothetical protein [Candidatus Gallacutalibacter pullistercoris]